MVPSLKREAEKELWVPPHQVDAGGEPPAQKKAKLAPLHVENVAPYSFLEDLVEQAARSDTKYFDKAKFGARNKGGV